MDGRLSKTCTNLRVVPADLLDALCSLSGRPSPPAGGHLSRCVHEHVLHAVASLPVGSLQPGDVSAATEVRAGLLNADVPSASDAAARCIQQTVDDLGPADLWTLARDTAMTLDELAWGATATLAGNASHSPTLSTYSLRRPSWTNSPNGPRAGGDGSTPTPFVPRCTGLWPISPTFSWKRRSPPPHSSTGPLTTADGGPRP